MVAFPFREADSTFAGLLKVFDYYLLFTNTPVQLKPWVESGSHLEAFHVF